jgi:hypothetical protein
MSLVSLTNTGGSLVVNPALGGVQEINLNDYFNLFNASNNTIDVPVSSGTTSVLNNNLPYTDYASLLSGVDGSVNAIILDASGDLYVGGAFTAAGDVSANNIAKWNGSAWSALGSGLDGAVYALTFDINGVLYAGGDMTDNLSKWDGTTWTSLGAGLNGPVYALTFDYTAGNILYFGGLFSAPSSNIASINTSTNTVINNGGADGAVRALTYTMLDNGQFANLIAGGDFNVIGTNSLNSPYIARLYLGVGTDYVSWSSLTSVNGSVHALRSTPLGLLYVGGNFTTPVTRVGLFTASFSGSPSTWTAYGTGVNDVVKALALDGSGNVFAGGDFTTAGESTANRIAKWDGAAWSTYGSGTNAAVNALATVSNTLYIGGDFTQANGATMNYITEHPISGLSGAVDVSVNSKFLYSLNENQQINVFVSNSGVSYTNGLLI